MQYQYLAFYRKFFLSSFTVIIFYPICTKGQGNGNPLALRFTPYDEIFPNPHFKPPPYIEERIINFVQYFFIGPQDQAEAEAILMTIWYYNSIYNMLSLVERMKRKQYTYAEFGDECVGDGQDDETKALEIQNESEDTMAKPAIISAHNFFNIEAWWEIVGNTVDNIWNHNQMIAAKICDFRRRGLICMKTNSSNSSSHEEEFRCNCAKDSNGVRMVAKRGGICAMEKNRPCNYTTASRLVTQVYEMEVYNTDSEKPIVYQTCFGNSFCTVDLKNTTNATCQCWPLITSETRAKRNVLLNYTVTGNKCDKLGKAKILKWGKWYVALTIIWLSIPLILILAPHWDDIWLRIVPGYYRHIRMGDRSRGMPDNLPMETYDVKMSEETKQFIEDNAEVLDVDDPEYFDKVDAVDDRDIDPLDRFILTPQCTDRTYYFEWPTVDKLKVWF